MILKRLKKFRVTASYDDAKRNFRIALILLVSTVLFLTLFLFLAEDITLFQAFWLSLTTMSTVGYGDISAVTVTGKIITIVLGYFIGISALANFFEKWVARIQKTGELLTGGYMENPDTDGYVLINYPGENYALTFIQEARSIEPEIPICIVDKSLEKLPQSIQLEGVHYCKGSLLQRDTYRKARLESAKAVIVFPDNTEEDADAKTSALVRQICDYVDTEKVKVKYLLKYHENITLFVGSNATPVREDMEIALLVQDCQDPYTAAFFQGLLKNTEGAIPRTVVPDKIKGLTWGQFILLAQQAAETLGIEVNPAGLVSNGEPDALPSSKTVIDAHHHIILIVTKEFRWDRFQEQIARQL